MAYIALVMSTLGVVKGNWYIWVSVGFVMKTNKDKPLNPVSASALNV